MANRVGFERRPERPVYPRLWTLAWVHRLFANLKTWALGIYHGLRANHLQAYLYEFVFRFNRRRTHHAAFRSLLGIAGDAQHVTYKMLIAPEP